MATHGDTTQQLKGPAFFMRVFAEDAGGQSTGSDIDKRYVRGKIWHSILFKNVCYMP